MRRTVDVKTCTNERFSRKLTADANITQHRYIRKYLCYKNV